ncbi:hypothetical protein F9047_10900 [Escherichia coli]|nr:hypothetical protein F9047_10900 [Escherichia coli]
MLEMLTVGKYTPSPIISSPMDAYFEGERNNKYGTVEWVVPQGVTSICCVVIGAGSSGRSGGLSWRNNIPVTPGEKLKMQVNSTASALLRETTILCAAQCGGNGGKTYNSVNDGGGNAGQSPHGRGGAGGYTGNGGDGHTFTGGPGPGSPGSGGGGGGGAVVYLNGSLTPTVCGGVGMYGQGSNGGADNSAGYPGSGGSGTRYGRAVDGYGVVRVVWGNYSFPTNAPRPKS